MYLRLKVGMKTVKKEQNYGRETEMLPVNKVAKKREKLVITGVFFFSRGKKNTAQIGPLIKSYECFMFLLNFRLEMTMD